MGVLKYKCRGISVLRNYNSSLKTLKTNAMIMIVLLVIPVNVLCTYVHSCTLEILSIRYWNTKHKVHEPGMYQYMQYSGGHMLLSMLHLLKYVSVLF